MFSQSLETLDVIERAMNKKCQPFWNNSWRNGQDYLRLDGSTSAHDRKKMVNLFNKPNTKPWVFLMSIKVRILDPSSLAVNLFDFVVIATCLSNIFFRFTRFIFLVALIISSAIN